MVNIEERILDFAIRIVKLKDYLVEEIKEYEIAKQILKSETKYWLRVLKGSKKLTEHEFESVYNECVEIEKILSAIVKTTKSRLEK